MAAGFLSHKSLSQNVQILEETDPGVADPECGGLRGWRTLGVAEPGSGGPWEWRTVTDDFGQVYLSQHQCSFRLGLMYFGRLLYTNTR